MSKPGIPLQLEQRVDRRLVLWVIKGANRHSDTVAVKQRITVTDPFVHHDGHATRQQLPELGGARGPFRRHGTDEQPQLSQRQPFRDVLIPGWRDGDLPQPNTHPFHGGLGDGLLPRSQEDQVRAADVALQAEEESQHGLEQGPCQRPVKEDAPVAVQIILLAESLGRWLRRKALQVDAGRNDLNARSATTQPFHGL